MNGNVALMYEKNNLKYSCIHYWIIGNASGTVSRGICRHCGALREFNNYPIGCSLENTAFGKLEKELRRESSEREHLLEHNYSDDVVEDGNKTRSKVTQ